jgi:phenylacetate-coenzyme A ligase PaaK-like adenylate-forming protein
MLKYRNGKLGSLLQQSRNSSFYCHSGKISMNGRFPVDSLANLPLLDKSELRTASKKFISRHRHHPFFKTISSGTTGVPLEMWFDDKYFISYFGWFRSFLRQNGINPRPSDTNMLAITAFRKEKDYSLIQPAVNHSLFYRVNIHESFWKSPKETVNYIAEKSPLVLCGMPTTLEMLADYMLMYPAASPIMPKAIITKSELLLPETRLKLRKVFGAPVFNTYGLTEVGGVVASECPAHSGYHINVEDYIVETVKPDGTPSGHEKEGELVITNLYHYHVPVIRYRTHDFATITRRRCKCGAVTPRILKLSGRDLNRFTDARGNKYNPHDAFGLHLFRLPVTRYQLIHKVGKGLTIYYTGDRDISRHPSIKEIKREFKKLYGDREKLVIRKIDNFDLSGKFQPCIEVDSEGSAS